MKDHKTHHDIPDLGLLEYITRFDLNPSEMKLVVYIFIVSKGLPGTITISVDNILNSTRMPLMNAMNMLANRGIITILSEDRLKNKTFHTIMLHSLDEIIVANR